MVASSDDLRAALLQTVAAFRVGMPARGNDALARFVTRLQDRLERGGSDAQALSFLPHLSDIIAAQERGDYLRVADVLEFDLLPLLLV